MRKLFLLFGFLATNLLLVHSQTIQNAGFENWTTDSMGIENPDSWIAITNFAPAPLATITKSSDKHAGNYSMKLSPVSFMGQSLPAVVEAILPATSVGSYLNFYAKSSFSAGDTLMAFVGSNAQSGIDGAGSMATSSSSNWAPFYVDLRGMTGATFDTIYIGFFASGNSTLYVDDISIGSSPVGTPFGNQMTGLKNNKSNAISFDVYPNPANQTATITLKNNSEKALITITDLTGKTIFNTESVENTIKIDCSAFNNGLYLVNISTSKGSNTTKLVITH